MSAKVNNAVAVLIFANTACHEVERKKVFHGEPLFDLLSDHTLKVVKKTGLPYFHFTENEQQGTSFGERFAKAIQEVFLLGYTAVITVGNDSPQLRSGHLLQAAGALQQHKSVLGPSTDGGFYLMGLKKEWFDYGDFIALPWQHRSLYAHTKAHLERQAVRVERLNVLRDVDSLAVLPLLLGHIKTLGDSLRKVLADMLRQQVIQHFKITQNYKSLSLAQPANKGSPVTA